MSRAVALAVLAAAALAACKPTLAAQTAPPAGRTARLDEVKGFWGIKHYRAELSQGVALAIHCHHGGPCAGLAVRSDDPEIAEVRSASLGSLEPSGFHGNQIASSGFVVIGKAPGTTRVHVRTSDGGRELAVTVVEPPRPSPPATVAAPR